MTNKEALITVSKSCKALAMERGFGKISDTDKTALNTLKKLVVEHQQFKEENQKLKNKETPKKPRRDRLFYNCHNGECDKSFIYYCPVCNVGSVEDMNYCGNCGQKLDWSDE